jgi:hypothetical protein
MPVVTEYFVEVLGVRFKRCFDIVSNVSSNDILEVFRGHVRVFVFDDWIELLKRFPFGFVDKIDNRLVGRHLKVVKFTSFYYFEALRTKFEEGLGCAS